MSQMSRREFLLSLVPQFVKNPETKTVEERLGIVENRLEEMNRVDGFHTEQVSRLNKRVYNIERTARPEWYKYPNSDGGIS